ncbi:MAG: hypothetical protein AAGC88_14880 [Bacteroidota bacterium]
MKKLIVLPGNGARNQMWGEECVEAYGAWFDDVHMQYYSHWESDEKNLDWQTEIEKLRVVKDTWDDEDEVFVIAKSIGTLVALTATAEQAIVPEKGVFFGMPLDLAAAALYQNDWTPLSGFSAPLLVFHNDNDPTTSYKFTKAKLHELQPTVTLVTLASDTHDYLDFSDYADQVKEFLGV